MVSSTERPNAIPKTKIVEGLIGIPKYPINPAVANNGNKFGIKATKIIFTERNKKKINAPVNAKANNNDSIKCSNK